MFDASTTISLRKETTEKTESLRCRRCNEFFLRDVTHSTREAESSSKSVAATAAAAAAIKRRELSRQGTRTRTRLPFVNLVPLCRTWHFLPHLIGRGGAGGPARGGRDDSNGTIATYPFCTVKRLLPCTSHRIWGQALVEMAWVGIQLRRK